MASRLREEQHAVALLAQLGQKFIQKDELPGRGDEAVHPRVISGLLQALRLDYMREVRADYIREVCGLYTRSVRIIYAKCADYIREVCG